MEENPKHKRIKWWMAACLVLTALLIDILLFILGLLGVGEVVNSIVAPPIDFLFIFWFWLLDVSFTKSPKRLSIMAVTALIGLIPFLNLLPELTLGVLATVLTVWTEDKSAIINKIQAVQNYRRARKQRQFSDRGLTLEYS